MSEKKMSENINLVFTEKPAAPERREPAPLPRKDVGPSSLVGRVGDNMSFHEQRIDFRNQLTRLWGWAWKDLANVFLGILRLFSFREK
ncbi:hypothetical protein [Solidesulfovibrio sp.]|uniref:hypothetical protein n=1 Tax=Solidesulfovibrio sp. TaxID=2910990 RepID=UPI002634DF13|nr:hypothetical protein [Solidesulfovibrio sp.]